MFTWLNKQGVQSDNGFVVQRTGRFTAEYRENGKVVTLDVEGGLSGGTPSISVLPSAFEHWNGERTVIPPEQQAQMFQNLRDAMEFQGLELVIEKGVGPER